MFLNRIKKALINVAKFLFLTGSLTAFLLLTGSIVFGTVNIGNAGLLTLTRNSFALLLALATVLFSWSRTLIEENKEQALKITRLGEACFFIALLFLVAAILKYYQVQGDSEMRNFYTAFLIGIVNVVFPVLFFAASCATLVVFFQMIVIWFKRFF